MAEVFAAEDLRLGRPVAVKVLRAQLSADETVRYRFEQEARTAARLSHPNVVGVIDTGEDDEVAFIIMERLDGTTLADELRRGPLSEERVREVARQVLSALQAAHDAGIVHRDVKPANVLTCDDGRVKVTDFGIATAIDGAQAITGTGFLVGTPAYVAPERLAGAQPSPSADLYSLGAVLYECLTGERPFQNASAIELISAVREQRPRPISELRPDVDPGLASIIESALEKDPADRPLSARAMSRLLEQAGVASAVSVRAGAGDQIQLLPGNGPPPTSQLNWSAGAELRPTQRLPAGSIEPLGARLRRSAVAGAAPGWRRARADGEQSSWQRRWKAVRATPAWLRAREVIGRYRVMVVFLGALLAALVIALSLAASSGPSPSAPTGSSRARTAAHSPTAPHVDTKGLPPALARAIQRLEKAVR